MKKETSWLSMGPASWSITRCQKKDSGLTAQGVEHDRSYSYEGGPNESQKALKRGEWLYTASTELLRPAAQMICLWGEEIPSSPPQLLFYWLALAWFLYGHMNISRPLRFQKPFAFLILDCSRSGELKLILVLHSELRHSGWRASAVKCKMS